MNFLNYYDPYIQDAELRDNYTTQSPIYIKGGKSKSIVIMDNVFLDNIGLRGGAINIDLQLNTKDDADPENIFNYSPFILARGNHFERNMAIFEGNAVYVKGGQKFDENDDKND